MKTCLFLLCLMASALVMCVRSKPHAKHRGISKHSHALQEKESVPEESHDRMGSVLPTYLPYEASSQEHADEEVTNEGGPTREVLGFGDEENKESDTPPVLLSEEALAHLLQASEEEEEEEEEQEEQPEAEGEVSVKESGEGNSEEEESRKEGEEEEENGEKEEEKAEGQRDAEDKKVKEEKEEVEEESDSSTESEIPVDLDYASDSDGSEPLESKLEEPKPLSGDTETQDQEEDQKEDGEEIPTVMADYDPEVAGEDAGRPQKKEQEEDKTQEKDVSTDEEKDSNNKQGDDSADLQEEAKNSMALRAGDKEEKHTNESSSHNKGKGRKQKKNQRKRKGQMQGDQPIPDELTNPAHRQTLGQEKTPDTIDNTVQRPKRRKSGKWAPMVGMNPVQIRATVELYPSLRPPPILPGQGAETNPCEYVRCKRGKVCKVKEDDKPVCVCQEVSDCPTSITELDHVCGTDNNTYDTSCQLFATKCNLEGTKKGHRLHLDYTGACKFIPPCLSTELAQFPLRMRDWLKNVLLQLYEHDTMSPGFLTPKQRARVQKIYESERRLHAGDHPIELLAQDFEKNYHMYIYPVHWQFAQMDQHPTDRYLSHSELAPLRVPLVPMEHCTSDFFQECDADKDKQVSFKEWGHCFGIKDEDMDPHLLF